MRPTSLPYAPHPADPSTSSGRSDSCAPRAFRMRRILLIDDDERLAPPLAASFKRVDFELDAAVRPSDGLAKLRAQHYDAAILDVMLPEMDGFALCRAIRRESDIPIVMLTARGE